MSNVIYHVRHRCVKVLVGVLMPLLHCALLTDCGAITICALEAERSPSLLGSASTSTGTEFNTPHQCLQKSSGSPLLTHG